MNTAEAINQAIDNRDAKLAARIVNRYRSIGATYNDILSRVQHYRPEVTAADWDALLYEADRVEGW